LFSFNEVDAQKEKEGSHAVKRPAGANQDNIRIKEKRFHSLARSHLIKKEADPQVGKKDRSFEKKVKGRVDAAQGAGVRKDEAVIKREKEGVEFSQRVIEDH